MKVQHESCLYMDFPVKILQNFLVSLSHCFGRELALVA